MIEPTLKRSIRNGPPSIILTFIIIEHQTLKHSIRKAPPLVPKSNFYGMYILGENSRHTSVKVSFYFHLQACAYKEFSQTIDKWKISKLNTTPRTRPFIIETGRTFSYIILSPVGPLNWADQILCDTGKPREDWNTLYLGIWAMPLILKKKRGGGQDKKLN